MMKNQAIDGLLDRLIELESTDDLFNPYTPLDDPGASIRRDNLQRYLLDMLQRQPRMLLLFEAPGYRGCALSGLPVTSERIMLAGIAKWDLFGAGYRPTSAHPEGVAEMTATILWNALAEHLQEPPLIWNTVPLHPHKTGNTQSNRTPRVSEQRMGKLLIETVVHLYRIEKILGVGRIAQRMLGELEYDFTPLRHPSQGGKADFIRGLVAANR